jgi:hypothetical protein
MSCPDWHVVTASVLPNDEPSSDIDDSTTNIWVLFGAKLVEDTGNKVV